MCWSISWQVILQSKSYNVKLLLLMRNTEDVFFIIYGSVVNNAHTAGFWFLPGSAVISKPNTVSQILIDSHFMQHY